MLNEITVTYEGAMHVDAVFADIGSVSINAPACCGGKGVGPSPKDLFAAGYASCVIMAMDIAARKGGFDISGAKISVSTVWAKKEPLLEEVNSKVVLPREFSDEQLDMLKRGSHNCPIHNSLRPEVKTTFAFEAA
ncbi:MAG: OsmC family protein, partial [Planctomycetota bacterium]|jgi:uncharacterized OsmC-like protein